MQNTTKKGGKVTVIVEQRILDPNKYGQLLATVLPTAIESEQENERLLEEVKRLLKKSDNLSIEEEKLLNLLTELIESYEAKAYPIPIAAPHTVIQLLMDDRGLKQKDLMPILGSKGVTSEVVRGKRTPSKAQALALGEFFGVSPDLFTVSLEQDDSSLE
ncbi:MAG: putative transcription regulator containing HTH domain [bacterium]|nr:MAG: putative transcription regulator containing HTH domain [bacterium]